MYVLSRVSFGNLPKDVRLLRVSFGNLLKDICPNPGILRKLAEGYGGQFADCSVCCLQGLLPGSVLRPGLVHQAQNSS